jgi:fumarate hydratase subunit beta
MEYHLKTPLPEVEVRKLKAGDVVYVTGKMFTARDEAHVRALEYHEAGKKLPLDTRGLVLYHCGPLVKKVEDKWIIVAAGPTTSARMESFEDEFISNFNVRLVVGKGGMGPKTTEAMKQFGAVYCDFTGGAAVLAAKAIKKVENVEWLDLGMPEAIWILEVEEFGPLIVTIDAHGTNLTEELMKQIENNREKIYQEIG